MSEELQRKLHLRNAPKRIECFDISNIQGRLAVGSMVTFDEGEPDKSRYRRFRIKTVPGADDFRMMYEVLQRRFTRAKRGRQLSRPAGGRRRQGAAQRRPRGPARARHRARSTPSAWRRMRVERDAAGRRDRRAARSASSCPAARIRWSSSATRPRCSCCSACATRRTASPSPTTASCAARSGLRSVLDAIPGIGSDAPQAPAAPLRQRAAHPRRQRRGLAEVPGISVGLAAQIRNSLAGPPRDRWRRRPQNRARFTDGRSRCTRCRRRCRLLCAHASIRCAACRSWSCAAVGAAARRRAWLDRGTTRPRRCRSPASAGCRGSAGLRDADACLAPRRRSRVLACVVWQPRRRSSLPAQASTRSCRAGRYACADRSRGRAGG